MASEARTETTETQTRPQPFPLGEAWPPHDTEESILGTDWHQMTITNLRLGINEIAHINRTPGQPLPWQALSQISLLGCLRFEGSAYRTMPDVFVYRRPIDQTRGSVTLVADGPPVLIIEVLSESTYESDIDIMRGKGYSYARAGVREYVTIDPTGHYLPEGIRAWRLVDGVYQPWEPGAEGRWRSAEINVAIGLEGLLAAVYTHDGRRILREGEVEQERDRLSEELAHETAEVARLRRLLEKRGESIE